MNQIRYPLAKQGIFRTIQGEGALLGIPMVFIRLAGCSVGCSFCDTDYGVSERLTVNEIKERVESVRESSKWIWITGGEPADHNLEPLLQEMQLCGKVALATSGTKGLGSCGRLIDFLSVSPHGTPENLVFVRGSQINLVPGLNDLKLDDWDKFDAREFAHRWVTPLWYHPSNRIERVAECIKFVENHSGWNLGVQAHKIWGIA